MARFVLAVSLLAQASAAWAEEPVGRTCPKRGGHDGEESVLLQGRRELTEPAAKGHRQAGLVTESARKRMTQPPLPENVENYKMEEMQTGIHFDCIRTKNFDSSGEADHQVILLHGFTEGMWMYREMLQTLHGHNHRAIACMGRGYNLNASHNPSNKEDYSFFHLRDDVYRLAAHLGWSQFHLVGHDIGAILGWFCMQGGASNPHNHDAILSFTSLGQPHNDPLNEAIWWKYGNPLQIGLLQDWRAYVLENSASIADDFLYKRYRADRLFNTPGDFQKALWWFNGMLDHGILGTPPLRTTADIIQLTRTEGVCCEIKLALLLHNDLRIEFDSLLPEDSSDDGVRFLTEMDIGPVKKRVGLICGNSSSTVLCNEYAAATIQLVSKAHNPFSRHYSVECGSKLLSEDCPYRHQVIDATLRNIENRNNDP